MNWPGAVERVYEVGARTSEALDVPPLCDLGRGVDLLVDLRSDIAPRAACAPLPQPEPDDEYDEDQNGCDE